MLLVALTFHSIFEGLAIGLQQEYNQLIQVFECPLWLVISQSMIAFTFFTPQIFVAVIFHKGIMAFSLGLNLAQARGMTVKYFIAASLIFSAASPFGMAIGIGISDLKESIMRDLANGVLQVCIILLYTI